MTTRIVPYFPSEQLPDRCAVQREGGFGWYVLAVFDDRGAAETYIKECSK
jgi:hypothetical protein